MLTHFSNIAQRMFQLNRSSEYAVRAALYLASHETESSISTPDIARAEDVPVEFLRKIVQTLIKGKIVRSQRGTKGGIVLARPASTITLLDVIEAAEGPLSLNVCMYGPSACGRSAWCAVHLIWCDAQRKLKESLSAQSLAEIAAAHTNRFAEFNRAKEVPPETLPQLSQSVS